jgi:penicillin-binding protein 1B
MALKRTTGTKRTKGRSFLWRIAAKILWIGYDIAFYLLLVGIVVAGIYGYSVTDDLIEKFEGRRWKIPGKVYSDSLTLLPGMNVNTINLSGRLIRQNYQQRTEGELKQGEFIPGKEHFDIYFRDFEYPWEKVTGAQVRLYLAGGQIRSIRNLTEDREIYSTELEPELIGRFFGPHREERDLVTYDEVSPYLINAIVAIEDKAFFRHHGLNIKGLIRMVLVNLRYMELRQGGSPSSW